MNLVSKPVPRSAAMLGYAGVIPFAALAAIFALSPATLAERALDGFLIYGAVILSFLGGIRWGAACSSASERAGALAISVLPSLWAAFFLWWPDAKSAAWGLLVGFLLLGIADWLRPGIMVPAWMRPLRARLTGAVALCHLPVVAVV